MSIFQLSWFGPLGLYYGLTPLECTSMKWEAYALIPWPFPYPWIRIRIEPPPMMQPQRPQNSGINFASGMGKASRRYPPVN